MLKIPSTGLALLLASGISYAQIVNPTGSGGGDVFRARSNTFTALNDFTAATLIPPSSASDPTGACFYAGSIYINSATGSEFTCVSGSWKKITTDFSALSGDVFSTTTGVATVQKLRNIALSTATPTAGQVLFSDGTQWLPQLLVLNGDVTSFYTANTVSKLQSYPLSLSSPATGQALVWNGSNVVFGAPGTSAVTLNGDVTGPSTAAVVARIQGVKVNATGPANGQIPYFSSADNQYDFTSIAGDVTGSPTATLVSKLQGISLSSTAPTTNQVLTYNGTQWAPATPSAVTVVAMTGDVTGQSNSSVVSAIQGKPVDSTAPVSGQVLSFNGTKYQPASLGGDISGSIGNSTVSKLQTYPLVISGPTNGQILFFNGTQFTLEAPPSAPTFYSLSGDVTGQTNASVVSAIQGKAVSTAAPTNGQVLVFNGTQYAPSAINATQIQGKAVSSAAPAGGQVLQFNATNNDYEPTTPSAATSVTMNGDVTGSSNSATVAKLQGVSISATAPTGNQFLSYVGSAWTPTTLPNLAGDVTGTIANNTVGKLQTYPLSLSGTPLSGQAPTWNGTAMVWGNPTSTGSAVTMGGDISGQSNTATVAKLQGNPVKAGTPTGGQMLTWNATNSDWEAMTYTPPAAPSSYPMSGDVTGTTANNTLAAIGGIAIAAGAPTTGQALIYNGTKLAYANPQAAANAIQLQSVNISATLPTNGQVLQYSSASNQWAPAANTVASSSITMGGDVTGTAAQSVVSAIQGKAVSNTAPTNGQVLAFNGTQYVPSNQSVTMSGDVTGQSSASVVAKIQGVAVVATAPTANQVLQYNGSSYAPTTLTKQVSWQFADSVNTLTTSSASSPNLAVNTGTSAWAIQSIYCISDDSATTTYQLSTGGTNIGPSGNLSCTSTGASTPAASLAVTTVAAGATISQSLITPSASLKHMTVVVTYQ